MSSPAHAALLGLLVGTPAPPPEHGDAIYAPLVLTAAPAGTVTLAPDAVLFSETALVAQRTKTLGADVAIPGGRDGNSLHAGDLVGAYRFPGDVRACAPFTARGYIGSTQGYACLRDTDGDQRGDRLVTWLGSGAKETTLDTPVPLQPAPPVEAKPRFTPLVALYSHRIRIVRLKADSALVSLDSGQTGMFGDAKWFWHSIEKREVPREGSADFGGVTVTFHDGAASARGGFKPWIALDEAATSVRIDGRITRVSLGSFAR